MKFTYDLTGTGWADGTLQIENQSCVFTASYFSDSLGALVKSLARLIPECISEDENVQSETRFDMYAEPSGTAWTFSVVNSQRLAVKIYHYDDIDAFKNQQLVMDSVCDLREFVLMVVTAMELLLRKHGIVGYADTWYDAEFPLGNFLKLKYWVQTGGKRFPTRTEDEPFLSLHFSNLQQEKDLME